MPSQVSDKLNRRGVLKHVATGAVSLGLGGRVVAKGDNGGSATGRYIVGTETKDATKKAKEKADSVHRTFNFGSIGTAVAGTFSEAARTNLEKRQDVRYVEADGQMQALGETVPWGIDRVDADVAHQDGYTGAGGDIAILDTGIDSDHSDLEANLGSGKSFIGCDSGCTSNSCHQSWDDDNGHGTHCAGIANAVNNSSDVVGVSTEATLHAVKVLDCDGYGSYSDISAGVKHATDNGWEVASMSLGGGSSSSTLRDACQYAADNGTLVVAAAGNSGSCTDCVMYPAKYDTTIAVSATDSTDDIASFSSTGPEIEIAAPGASILSTVPGGTAIYSGTSMACPHVSGAAVMLMANGYSRTEARNRLGDTAEDIGLSENDQGHGLLDVEAAITSTQNMIGEAGTVTVDGNWQTVTLDGSYTDPVVVSRLGTDNDSQPVHTRVRNAKSDSFELRLEEWEYQDGTHNNETVHYVVFESGYHTTNTGIGILAGTVQADGGGWTTESYGRTFSSQRYAFTQVMTENDSTAVSTRITDVGLDSFDVTCQEEEANRDDQFSDHAQETIGYLIAQPRLQGSGSPGESIASVLATDEWTSGALQDSYSETPVILHGLQSYFGRDTTDIRGRNYSATSFEVLAQEEQSANNETNHVREYVATLAFEDGEISEG